MYIKRIIIKNFRSIDVAHIDVSDLNIIVGLNDIGKSNLLKAINLFFNGETDFGKRFNFEDDYCFFAPIRKKMAKEITIELFIQPPSSYSSKEVVKWTKVWRKDGIQDDKNEVKTVSGGNFPERSKVFAWLKNLKYKYVPAVRSDIYFQNLLGDLHDTLADTISEKLKDAGVDFIGKIKENTENITININKRLGINSDIQLPSNLKELFKTLDFRTVTGSFDVSLQKRGDGIKTRHIPVILHFLAEQESRVKSKGSPRVNTIWGYEEPENNLELLKAYDLAKELLDYSREIQMFVSSHSPAFYSLIPTTNVSGFLSKRDESSGGTVYERIAPASLNRIDEHMGVLSIITPYIDKEVERSKSLSRNIEELKKEVEKMNLPSLFVEGISDYTILKYYFSNAPLKGKVDIKYSKEEGGVSFVADMILAWSHLKNVSVGIGIFDKDEAGNKYKSIVNADSKVIEAKEKKKVAVISLEPSDHLIALYKKGIDLPFGIEELFPHEVWQHAEATGWLENRGDFKYIFKDEIPIDKTPLQLLSDKGVTTEEQIYIFKKVRDSSKVAFANYVVSLLDFTLVFAGFERTKDKINQKLNAH